MLGSPGRDQSIYHVASHHPEVLLDSSETVYEGSLHARLDLRLGVDLPVSPDFPRQGPLQVNVMAGSVKQNLAVEVVRYSAGEWSSCCLFLGFGI
jgi:hypothetical protein